MQTINDMINRWRLGNSGNVKSWSCLSETKTIPAPSGRETLQSCRALVRDDGKILSIIDCWDGLEDFQLPSNLGRIIHKADGPYLVELNKRYEIDA